MIGSNFFASLLVRFSEFRLHDMWNDPRVDYERFNHKGMSSNYGHTSWIPLKNNIVRRFAIEVEAVCNATQLAPDLYW